VPRRPPTPQMGPDRGFPAGAKIPRPTLCELGFLCEGGKGWGRNCWPPPHCAEAELWLRPVSPLEDLPGTRGERQVPVRILFHVRPETHTPVDAPSSDL
jgi:hypothetical protein